MPVLTNLGRQGDFKDGVLKVNIPRNDLKVVVDGIATPTPFGFGGWIALTKGTGMDVMMGDLVLTEEEVSPVMSAVLDAGLDVTAVHNHFFFENPRIFQATETEADIETLRLILQNFLKERFHLQVHSGDRSMNASPRRPRRQFHGETWRHALD